jgi:hypothetical protein
MAREVRHYGVTIPAGTPIAAPTTTALTMPARIVRKVRIRIPPGPNGSVGFALASSGVPIIPWGPNQWFVADNEVIELPLEGQIDSGAWQLRGYNTGAYPHTIYLTFELDPPQAVGVVAVAPSVPLASVELGSVLPPVDTSGPSDGGLPDGGGGAPAPGDDGYAIAKWDAEVALAVRFGLPLPGSALPPPATGSIAAVAYDAGRAAAVAAIAALALAT